MTMMGIINRGSCRVAVDVPHEAACKVIRKAIGSGAELRLTVQLGGDSESVTGRIVSADDTTLIIAPKSPPPAALANRFCEAVMRLDKQEYMFQTEVLEMAPLPGGERLRLARPQQLQTWQRRRFCRATVADSAAVTIRSGSLCTQGAVLNVSEDGLACRIDEAENAWSIDDLVAVRFALEDHSKPFEFEAVVKSAIPAGTPDTMILGVQFQHKNHLRPEHERLARALKTYM